MTVFQQIVHLMCITMSLLVIIIGNTLPTPKNGSTTLNWIIISIGIVCWLYNVADYYGQMS